ncbi:hypothetical protein GLAREA_11265 [Glarea lozoyensis ATCC 20868]|uniref:Uncharacterized protein n=1 Tax=Glarea lozoyensis (strain ATCC 20868 / MF5171) TaxID=1116229 RepID=S3DCV2_GLAL2|nr:uncharacterized protein GLAREA_11265 [Glarea lozoyensis ATCC 20868]EPE35565.1 hypothetical protein GLAREA_11265 [Glarea lozoyensis ATCC 20868]
MEAQIIPTQHSLVDEQGITRSVLPSQSNTLDDPKRAITPAEIMVEKEIQPVSPGSYDQSILTLRARYQSCLSNIQEEIQMQLLEQDIASGNLELHRCASAINTATEEIQSFQKARKALARLISSNKPKINTQEERIQRNLESWTVSYDPVHAINHCNEAIELIKSKEAFFHDMIESSRLLLEIRDRKAKIKAEQEKMDVVKAEMANTQNSILLDTKSKVLPIEVVSADGMRNLIECAISVLLHKVVAMMSLADDLPQAEPPTSCTESNAQRGSRSLDSLRYDFFKKHMEHSYFEAQRVSAEHETKVLSLKRQLKDSRQEMHDKLAEQGAEFERIEIKYKELLGDAKMLLQNRDHLLTRSQEEFAILKNRVDELKPLFHIGYKVRAARIERQRAENNQVGPELKIIEAGSKACYAADVIADSLIFVNRSNVPCEQIDEEFSSLYCGFTPHYIRKMDHKSQSMLIDVTNWWSDINVWYHPGTKSYNDFNQTRISFANGLSCYYAALQNDKSIREDTKLLAAYRLLKRKHEHASTMSKRTQAEIGNVVKIGKKQDQKDWKSLHEGDRKLLETAFYNGEDDEVEEIGDDNLDLFKL